jgi:carbon-monoxide dehydrogenase small subunit
MRHLAADVERQVRAPGIVMTFEAFLKENPNPSDEQIRDALSGNLCRCTGYHNIVAAIRKAATQMQGSTGYVAP